MFARDVLKTFYVSILDSVLSYVNDRCRSYDRFRCDRMTVVQLPVILQLKEVKTESSTALPRLVLPRNMAIGSRGHVVSLSGLRVTDSLISRPITHVQNNILRDGPSRTSTDEVAKYRNGIRAWVDFVSSTPELKENHKWYQLWRRNFFVIFFRERLFIDQSLILYFLR